MPVQFIETYPWEITGPTKASEYSQIFDNAVRLHDEFASQHNLSDTGDPDGTHNGVQIENAAGTTGAGGGTLLVSAGYSASGVDPDAIYRLVISANKAGKSLLADLVFRGAVFALSPSNITIKIDAQTYGVVGHFGQVHANSAGTVAVSVLAETNGTITISTTVTALKYSICILRLW